MRERDVIFSFPFLALLASILFACVLGKPSTRPSRTPPVESVEPVKDVMIERANARFEREIVLGQPSNPLVFALEREPDLLVDQAGHGNLDYFDALVPLVTLRVEQKTRVKLDTTDMWVLLQREDGAWISKEYINNVELEEGTYRVWLRPSDKEPKPPHILKVTDLELAFRFDDDEVRTHTIGGAPLESVFVENIDPVVFDGFCNHFTNQPVLLVTAPKLTEARRVELIDQPGDVFVFGPLEDRFSDNLCVSEREIPSKRPGTYAIFVIPDRGVKPKGEESIITIGDLGAADPMRPVREIPAKLPLHAREISRYYGYYIPFDAHTTFIGTSLPPLKVEALFASAPAQLFVFSKEARGGIQAGEPMLLARHGKEWSRVIRLDGTRVEVRTSTLSTEAPAEIATPPVAKFKMPEDQEDAWDIVAPPQVKHLRAYSAKVRVYERCRALQNQKATDREARAVCGHDALLEEEAAVFSLVYGAREDAKAEAIEAMKTKF